MPSPQQLLAVINTQTEIAKLGIDLGAVMARVVDRTLALIAADGAAIELAEGEHMVYRAASGIAAGQIGLRLARASSLSGLCVQLGETLRCDDAETDPRVDQAACRAVGLRSMIVMPLCHHGETVGVLKAMSAQPHKFGEAEVTLLGLLSEAVAAAMFHAAKYDSDELFHRATHDSLTDLANRALFMDHLRNALSRGGRGAQPVGVLMIDMDGLKQINDTHGHRIGDEVIREFASRLKRGARQSDTVARLGGDEFGIILAPLDAAHNSAAAVTRLEAEIALPFEFEGRPYRLQASIGAAHFPDDSDNHQQLIEIADRRMYGVKQNRPGRRAASN